jgi:hypothetical protein
MKKRNAETHEEAVFVTAGKRARLNDMLGRLRFRAEELVR